VAEPVSGPPRRGCDQDYLEQVQQREDGAGYNPSNDPYQRDSHYNAGQVKTD
jgi:hypothetical protein